MLLLSGSAKWQISYAGPGIRESMPLVHPINMYLKYINEGLMLNLSVRQLVKGTVPVLREHGVALTSHFYARMFEHNPEMRQVFNQGHQRAGQQQQALAMAVLAYAEEIDDPSVLLPVLTMIANKHISLGVRAEHYAIVGKHLLASIREVLGAAASEELIDAWAAAYGALAAALIGLENQGYQEMVQQPGGWTGWRGFRVAQRVVESDEITSFHLTPADGGGVPAYRPGQYISLRILVPELGYMQPRQYSLSAAPGASYLRISVKREAGSAGKVAGMVSNLLHDQYHEGAVLDLASPAGDFFLNETRSTPVVLISGGVGITPMLAMLEQLLASGSARQVRFVHACRHGAVHAFKQHVAALAARHPTVRSLVYYETPRSTDCCGQDYHHAGRLDLAALDARDAGLLPLDADYYLCGPGPFMAAQQAGLEELGVPPALIHLELFGTGGAGQS
jgi:nitric oxide dioxygenase